MQELCRIEPLVRELRVRHCERRAEFRHVFAENKKRAAKQRAFSD